MSGDHVRCRESWLFFGRPELEKHLACFVLINYFAVPIKKWGTFDKISITKNYQLFYKYIYKQSVIYFTCGWLPDPFLIFVVSLLNEEFPLFRMAYWPYFKLVSCNNFEHFCATRLWSQLPVRLYRHVVLSTDFILIYAIRSGDFISIYV